LTGTGQRLLDDEAQKIRRPSGLLETTARENSLERGANFARARLTGLVDFRRVVVATRSAFGHFVSYPVSLPHCRSPTTITTVRFLALPEPDSAA